MEKTESILKGIQKDYMKDYLSRKDLFGHLEKILKMSSEERKKLNLFEISSELFFREKDDGFEYFFPLVKVTKKTTNEVDTQLVWEVTPTHLRTNQGYIKISEYNFELATADVAIETDSTYMSEPKDAFIIYPPTDPDGSVNPKTIESYLPPMLIANFEQEDSLQPEETVDTFVIFGSTRKFKKFQTSGYFFSYKTKTLSELVSNLKEAENDPNAKISGIEYSYLASFSKNISNEFDSAVGKFDSQTKITKIADSLFKSVEFIVENDKKLVKEFFLGLKEDKIIEYVTDFGKKKFVIKNVNGTKHLARNVYSEILEPKTPIFMFEDIKIVKKDMGKQKREMEEEEEEEDQEEKSDSRMQTRDSGVSNSNRSERYDPESNPQYNIDIRKIDIQSKDKIKQLGNDPDEAAELLKKYAYYWQSIHNKLISEKRKPKKKYEEDKIRDEEFIRELEKKQRDVQEIINILVTLIPELYDEDEEL